MKLLQKISFYISSALMRLLLFFTITTAVIAIIFGNSGYIKNALTESNAYDRFIPSIIQANIKEEQTRESIPFNDKDVQQTIINSFPSEDLKTKTETVIDSFYDWLQGSSQRVEFSVDFTSNKFLVASGLSEQAFQKMQGLPVCEYQPEVIDPFYTDCSPSNMDFIIEQLSLQKQIFESDSFLAKTVLTADDLPKDQSGKSILERYKKAPQIFTWIKRAPWILGGLTIICAIAYGWLFRRKREGISAVGYAILGSTLSLVLLTLIFGFILPYLTRDFELGIGGSGTQQIVDDVFKVLTKNFDTMVINISLQAAAIGLLVVLFEKMTRPVSKYDAVAQKAGLVTGLYPKLSNGRQKNKAVLAPIVSSDTAHSDKLDVKNKKYRKIPKGDI